MTTPTDRPLSPHLQVWRWHVTMLSSILHRASGVALYGLAILAVWWLLALAAGPIAFADIQAFMDTILGKLILVGAGAAVGYHAINGIRHMVWDLGHGYDPKVASMTSWIPLITGIAAALWVAAQVFTGGAS